MFLLNDIKNGMIVQLLAKITQLIVSRLLLYK